MSHIIRYASALKPEISRQSNDFWKLSDAVKTMERNVTGWSYGGNTAADVASTKVAAFRSKSRKILIRFAVRQTDQQADIAYLSSRAKDDVEEAYQLMRKHRLQPSKRPQLLLDYFYLGQEFKEDVKSLIRQLAGTSQQLKSELCRLRKQHQDLMRLLQQHIDGNKVLACLDDRHLTKLDRCGPSILAAST